ncbi:MAG: ankyrin repeat domain-containing protein [Planctomycetes bacterium]|nr:ankyrin repeat domain-containing protein [Planctomycetota bacterium]
MQPDERLLDAVRRGDAGAVAAALRAAADPNANHAFEESLDREWLAGTWSTLHVAVRLGNRAVVAELLRAGADPNVADTVRGRTPLVEAAASGRRDLVDMLLAAGASPLADSARPDRDVLAAAADGGHAEVAALLAAAGAQATARALEIAAFRGRVDLVAICRDRGADLAAPAALAAAARAGAVAVLQWFVDQGVDVGGLGGDALCEAANASQAPAVAFLLAAGVPVGYRNSYRWTPLHFAAWQGDLASCEALLAAGADPTATDGHGRTPRSWAEEAARPAHVDRLLRAETGG